MKTKEIKSRWSELLSFIIYLLHIVRTKKKKAMSDKLNSNIAILIDEELAAKQPLLPSLEDDLKLIDAINFRLKKGHIIDSQNLKKDFRRSQKDFSRSFSRLIVPKI